MHVEYREVPGFPHYRVGDDGSVWTCRSGRHGGWSPWQRDGKWRRLRPSRNRHGYLRVVLTSPNGKCFNKLIHRLVLETFVGPCPPGMEACHHPDPDPSNNRFYNLRWDTRSGNHRDILKHRRQYLTYDEM